MAPGLRRKEIRAPLIMPATGTEVGIVYMLAIYLHTLTQTGPSRIRREAGFNPSWFGHPLEWRRCRRESKLTSFPLPVLSGYHEGITVDHLNMFFNSHDNGQAPSTNHDHYLAKGNCLAYKMRTLLARSPISHPCSLKFQGTSFWRWHSCWWGTEEEWVFVAPTGRWSMGWARDKPFYPGSIGAWKQWPLLANIGMAWVC